MNPLTTWAEEKAQSVLDEWLATETRIPRGAPGHEQEKRALLKTLMALAMESLARAYAEERMAELRARLIHITQVLGYDVSILDAPCDALGHAVKALIENYQRLFAERDALLAVARFLPIALDHLYEHMNGCLYCGEGEIVDGTTTAEHQRECWWYQAQAALAALPNR